MTQEQHITVTASHARGALLVMLIVILLHLSLLWLPGINLEWVFADGAKYFAYHDPVFLRHYFLLEANTLGMPFLGYVGHWILPFLDYNTVLRILSGSSFLLIGYSLLRLHSLLKQDYSPALLLAVVFLNPLIWTFGGRGTADLFPAALTLFAVTLFWQPGRSPVRLAIAIVAYGIAITLKYHAILLLPIVGLEMLSRPGARLKPMLLQFSSIVGLILVLPGLYVVVARQLYGFWFVPPKFRAIHGPTLHSTTVLMNIIAYAAYLCLLLLPYSLSAVWEWINTARKALIASAAGSVVFVIGFYALRVGDEMRFGPLDAYVNPRIYGGLFLVFAAIVVVVSRQALLDAASPAARRYLLCIFAGVALFVFVLSFTRPAQRYLLFVLPLSYFFVINRSRSKNYMTVATVWLYSLLIVFITLNQVATGAVAQKMTQQIAARGLLDDTEPGDVIRGVDGDRFPDEVNGAVPKQHYMVIVGNSPQAIVTVESHPAPLVHKVLSLVPYEVATTTTDIRE